MKSLKFVFTYPLNAILPWHFPKNVLWGKQIILESLRKRLSQLKGLKSHQEPSEVISSRTVPPPRQAKRMLLSATTLLHALGPSVEPKALQDRDAERTSLEMAVAEAALLSIFTKALTWCWTASFGCKPSFFQVQGRAGWVSVGMASSAHSGCWV